MTSHHDKGIVSGLRAVLAILVLVSGVGAAVLTVGAFFREEWWLFDFAANYRWHLLWALVVAAIVYALSSKGITSIVFLAAALTNVWLIAPLWMEGQPAATSSSGVTVVHADVRDGIDDIRFLQRWIFDSEADLVLVAGATEEQVDFLTARGSPYMIISAPEDPNEAGIVILGVAEWPVETFTSETLGERAYRITIGSNDETVEIVTAWGEAGSNSENAEKLAARLAIVSQAVETASHPVAVIGNLGATRWVYTMEAMRRTLNLRDATEGLGYLATSPVVGVPVLSGWVGLPIDIVLMTNEITPIDLKTGPDISTNHLPVTVVIGPAAQE